MNSQYQDLVEKFKTNPKLDEIETELKEVIEDFRQNNPLVKKKEETENA